MMTLSSLTSPGRVSFALWLDDDALPPLLLVACRGLFLFACNNNNNNVNQFVTET
jgi:hypothetical protein